MHTRLRIGDFCERCGIVNMKGCASTRCYCSACQSARAFDTGAAQARYAVSRAVARGDLPPAKQCLCVDCGGQARDYDHRDNAKPLDVQPVCRSCNKLRGPARPVLTFELPALTTAQLRALGSAAADRGEQIYEAEIRSGLTSDELIDFEAGYFARQFEAERNRLVCAEPV